MTTAVIIVALVLIVCGLLVKRFPFLLSGYNTMPAEKKKKVDMKGLSAFACYSLVGMGLFTLLFYFFCLALKFHTAAGYGLFISFLYLPYFLIKVQSYDHNPRRKVLGWSIILAIILVLGILVLLFYGMMPVTAEMKSDKVMITGMYGREVPVDDIQTIRLTDSLPDLKYRSNGFSIGNVKKGWFKCENGEKCLLFITSDIRPFILIKQKSGLEIYINSSDSVKTRQMCTSLRSKMKSLLEGKIENILRHKDATVGIAVLFDDGDTLTINNDYHYPMLSVFKFPLALAVLDYLDKKQLPLDTKISVLKKDLLSDTYSPLRDAHPNGGVFTIKELLTYTVSQSDNNACDILLRYIGGTGVVQKYIAELGLKDMEIVADEQKMHEHIDNQYLNWTKPYQAVLLLDLFRKKDLFAAVYKDFLNRAMIETSTGSNKIKGLLPVELVVGHKTGSSSRDVSGRRIGDNDIAFICLPDGRSYSIAVFVTHSLESDEVNASIIAEISKVIYDYFL